ncbi:MAG: hypothetical protein ACOY3V_07070 [Pseudomonadota bacterium]
MNLQTAIPAIFCLVLASCVAPVKQQTTPAPTPEIATVSEQKFGFDDGYYKISGEVVFTESRHTATNVHTCKINLALTNNAKTDYSGGWITVTLITPENASFKFTDTHINRPLAVYDTQNYLLLDEEGTCPGVARINTYLMMR